MSKNISKNINKNRLKDLSFSDQEQKRRRREVVFIFIIILVVILAAFIESRVIHFGAGLPVSNTILMFILINIKLLLLILLIFLVIRNLVKLLYERKTKIMGAKLRTRLVVAFVSLTLLPTTVLFFFSINFITNSIEFWFNAPVEQALENSLEVGRRLYAHAEENNKFYLKRISYQIKAKHLLAPAKKNDLAHYVQIVQREFNLHAVELYDANSKRITYSLSPELDGDFFKTVSAGNLQKENPPKGVWTISEGLSAGEIIRTIGTVPFGANRIDTKAFIVLSILISSDLSENMKSISRGVEEYQQIKLLKKPVQATYYITLSIVGLLVVFCAVWFGFFLAKSISIPIKELAEGTRRVAEGDLSFSIGIVADDEIGSLVDSFNKMTRDLRFGRDQIELSARMLREQNVEIEEERQYMEIVLKNISAGVITLDAGGFVATINKSAEKMLDLKSNEILNKSYKNLLKGRHLNLAKEIMASLASSRKNFVELPTRMTVAGMPRSFMVHLNELKNDAGRHIGIVMVIDDLTELEKAQRMIAWREVARRIAHEVKNPLTPITLSAQRLNRKYSERLNESVFDECIHMIIDHVELIRNLVNEFSVFARFPTANPKPCDLPAIIKETVALYKEGHQHINIEIYISDNIPSLKLDRQQIKQAIINLIDNAIGAIKDQGRIVISLTHDPILKMVRIEVADDGTGVSDEVKTRLFEPNFSTKKGGMGLGLTIVSAIVSDHNGMISVQDNQPRGAKIIIELPV